MTENLPPLLENVRSLISHDLRNPLSAAWTTAAFMAEMDAGQDVLVTRNIQTIQSALGRAIAWIDDLVTTIELEKGLRRPEATETDSGQVFAAARERYPTSGEIRWPGGEPVRLGGDATLLGRAVAALVANADRHGRSPSGTSVILSPTNGHIRIDVTDQGAGVGDDRMEDLFTPLGDPKRAQREIGGLGLAFCRAAVQAHGGSVGFEPNQPRGSRFWLQVPVSPQGAEAP